MSKLREILARIDEIKALAEESRRRSRSLRLAAQCDAVGDMATAFEEARALLEGCEEIIERLNTDPGCDCRECETCGRLPNDCSGTECAKTCGCTQCETCEATDTLESICEALGR